jgi:hypothetical protein
VVESVMVEDRVVEGRVVEGRVVEGRVVEGRVVAGRARANDVSWARPSPMRKSFRMLFWGMGAMQLLLGASARLR